MVVDNSAGEDPDFGEFMMNAVVVHPDYLKSNGETIRKFNRALHKASTWLLDHPAEEAVASMKVFLGRLDDKVILEGLQKTRLGIPRTPRRLIASQAGITLGRSSEKEKGSARWLIATV